MNNLLSNRNLIRKGKHEKYNNVYVYMLPTTLQCVYEAHITISRKAYCKRFMTAEEASKFIDRLCLKNNLPQKNNSYARAEKSNDRR